MKVTTSLTPSLDRAWTIPYPARNAGAPAVNKTLANQPGSIDMAIVSISRQFPSPLHGVAFGVPKRLPSGSVSKRTDDHQKYLPVGNTG